LFSQARALLRELLEVVGLALARIDRARELSRDIPSYQP
jgi:hypothetical protein